MKRKRVKIVLFLIAATWTRSSFPSGANFMPSYIPAPVLDARTVYIMDSSNYFAVDEVVSQLKQWGRFTVVSNRTKADLVIDVRFAEESADHLRVMDYNLYSHQLSSHVASSTSKGQLLLVVSNGDTLSWYISDDKRIDRHLSHAEQLSESVDRLVRLFRRRLEESR